MIVISLLSTNYSKHDIDELISSNLLQTSANELYSPKAVILFIFSSTESNFSNT